MIKLEKDGRNMEVRTDVQASAFLSNGWKKVEQTKAKETYTKTDIMRMKLEDLKTLANEVGMTVEEEITGAKLKERIIEKLGL